MAKKKAAKRTSGGDEGATEKRSRKRGEGGGKKHKASKGLLLFFMNALIQAGAALGKDGEVPESADEQRQRAQAIRQYAERLERQTKNFGGDESVPGGGEAQPADTDE